MGMGKQKPTPGEHPSELALHPSLATIKKMPYHKYPQKKSPVCLTRQHWSHDTLYSFKSVGLMV